MVHSSDWKVVQEGHTLQLSWTSSLGTLTADFRSAAHESHECFVLLYTIDGEHCPLASFIPLTDQEQNMQRARARAV